MAFRSKAQAKHFQDKLANGDITEDEYAVWEKGTKWNRLKKRLHPKKREKSERATKRRSRTRIPQRP